VGAAVSEHVAREKPLARASKFSRFPSVNHERRSRMPLPRISMSASEIVAGGNSFLAGGKIGLVRKHRQHRPLVSGVSGVSDFLLISLIRSSHYFTGFFRKGRARERGKREISEKPLTSLTSLTSDHFLTPSQFSPELGRGRSWRLLCGPFNALSMPKKHECTSRNTCACWFSARCGSSCPTHVQ
jgi:hypothetical protein